MAKNKSLLFKILLLAIGKTLKRSIGTLSVLFLVRLLAKDVFGTYRQVLFIIGILVTVIEFGIPKSILYFVPKEPDNEVKRRFISQGYLLLSLLAVLAAICLYFFSNYIGVAFNNPELSILLKIYAPSVIFLAISQNYFSNMLISLDMHAYAAYSYVFVGIPNTLWVIAASFAHLKLSYIFSISLIVILLQYLIVVIIMSRINKNLFYFPKRSLLNQQIRYTSPLGLSIFTGILAVQLDKLVVSLYFSPSMFALYTVGAMEIPFVGNLFIAVNATITPKIAEYSSSDRKGQIETICTKATKNMSILIFPIFCFLFVYAEPLLSLLYTREFIGAVPIFRIYLPIVLMNLSLCQIIILGHGKTGILLKASLLSTAMNVILNFVFVKYFGLVGPAIATVGCRLLIQGLYLGFVLNALNYRIGNLFPLKDMAKIFFISALTALCLYPMVFVIKPPIFLIPLALFLFIVFYLTVLYHTGVFTKEEKNLLINRFSIALKKVFIKINGTS